MPVICPCVSLVVRPYFCTLRPRRVVLNVQKYGRTTKLTHGQITGINATVDVCYEVFIIFCVKSARFVDQLVIEPGSFSGGGDSGSLIVTDDQNKNPVGLLFAGSSTQTIANRIDLVLNNFGVHVDGGAPPPPPAPVTDVAVTSVTAPAAVTQGVTRSEEHTSELQSLAYLVCRLLLEKKKKIKHSLHS